MKRYIPVLIAVAVSGSAAAQTVRYEVSATGSVVRAAAATTATAETTRTALFTISPGWLDILEQSGFSKDDIGIPAPPREVSAEEKRRIESRRHYFMGAYHLEHDEPSHALGEFRAALEHEPDSTPIKLAIANAYARTKNYDAATKLLDEVLAADPESVRALAQKAEMLMAQGEEASGNERRKLLDESVAAFRKASAIQPRNIDILRGIASAYFSVQEIDNIIETYKTIIEINPRDTHGLLVLGNVYLRTGRAKEALPYFQRIVELRRGFTQGYIYLAQAQYEVGRANDALRTLKDAILIDARNPELLRRFDVLINEMAKRRNGTTAIKQYERFAAEYPYAVEVQRLYAEKLVEAGQHPAAITQYKKMLKLETEHIDTLIAIGRLYLQQENFDEAVNHFSQAVEIDPEKVEVYDAIAVSLIGQNNRPKAVELYRKAIAQNPTSQRLYISLAVLLQQDNQREEALKVLDEAIEKAGQHAELYAIAGQIHETMGNQAKAADYFGKAYAKSPTNSVLFARLLLMLIRQGDENGVHALLTVAEESFKEKPDEFHSLVGDTYFTEGRTSEAVSAYERAVQIEPSKLSIVARLVQVHNLQGQYDRSIAVLDKAAGGSESDDELARLKIDTYLAKKDFDNGLRLARQLAAAQPSSLDGYRVLVDALSKAGKPDEAIKAVDQAEQRIGRNDDIMSLRGIVLYQQKKYDEAEKVFRDLTRENSKNKDIYYYFLGSLYLDQKRYEASEGAFRRSIEANPNNDSSLNALGYMFADRGVKLDESEELIRRALELNPSAPHILDSMGWVLFKKGKIDEGLVFIERAHRLMGDDAEILDHLGDIYAAKGDESRALEYWRRSLAIDQSQEKVRAKIAAQEK